MKKALKALFVDGPNEGEEMIIPRENSLLRFYKPIVDNCSVVDIVYGNYSLCGRSFDGDLIYAFAGWEEIKYEK